MDKLLQFWERLRWQDVLDIVIVAFLIYRVMLIIRGTRAMQMVAGLGVLMVIYFVAAKLELLTLHWILGTFLSSLVLLIIIVFQDDIRRALTQMGQTPFLKARVERSQVMEEIIKAVTSLADRYIGALIVIERETGLKEYIETGTILDARVNRELICCLFNPSSPLHDGAVIIREGRIATAGSILPLTTNPNVSKYLGTRHRAALGITELTDALAIVVSEERGAISLAVGGHITPDIDESTLRRMLLNLLGMGPPKSQPWWKRKIF
ncbi:TIGR00159 family protein [Thermosulfuriphilus ammonigenes]|uniref:Diadenylate cyclase n=1 Tax=Thermosulfuriphilus ammonigenes TaxID=1936021 RepID=A0A6G7PXJ0_9BACT|nr:diadenylate cyclase CdaA [Thermosulfuriphilus ammonigenes]MBA2847668.1 diadenylate cyclase [Thermosulfuriphilus ammonigenes]QIJ72123.1 TIGR00159 family protein [Thermosulfuriphilus ammonigenes]